MGFSQKAGTRASAAMWSKGACAGVAAAITSASTPDSRSASGGSTTPALGRRVLGLEPDHFEQAIEAYDRGGPGCRGRATQEGGADVSVAERHHDGDRRVSLRPAVREAGDDFPGERLVL